MLKERTLDSSIRSKKLKIEIIYACNNWEKTKVQTTEVDEIKQQKEEQESSWKESLDCQELWQEQQLKKLWDH